MKSIFSLVTLLFISTAFASETCYEFRRQNEGVIGVYCFTKDPATMGVAESAQVTGHYRDQQIDLPFVRLANKSYQGCIHPKDRPAICKTIDEQVFMTPYGPQNNDRPTAPDTLYFTMPDFKGHAWDSTLHRI